MELEALRWIHGKAVARRMSAPVEKGFQEVVADLRKFRTDVLGTLEDVAELDEPFQQAPESFTCLTEWSPLTSTDGAHVEVVQGITSAADAAMAAEIASAADMRDAQPEDQKRSAELNERAMGQTTESARIRIRVEADGGANPTPGDG